MKITIAFTVYDRVEYLKQTLDSWSHVRNKNNYNFVFKVETSERLDDIVKTIESFKNKNGCSIKTIINDPKSGVGKNQYEALSLCFDELGSEAVIMAEDDVVVSEDILEYFEYVFKKYKDDKEILTACSHRYVSPTTKDVIIKEQSFDPWVWGTWKTRWDQFLKNDWDLENFELLGTLVGGFDYHIVYRVLPNNGLVSIFPAETRSKHIGRTGTYANPEHYFNNPYFIKDRSENIFKILDK